MDIIETRRNTICGEIVSAMTGNYKITPHMSTTVDGDLAERTSARVKIGRLPGVLEYWRLIFIDET